MSHSDTDTESESEYCPSVHKAVALEVDTSEKATIAPSAELARNALHTLQTIDVAAVRRDNSLHVAIQHASTCILNFLDMATDDNIAVTHKGLNLIVFTEILHPSFLTLLFNYRTAFCGIAAQCFEPGTVVSVVVCWVDSILAKLGEVVITIAGGLLQDNRQSQAIEMLRKQREDDSIRASAQLPQKWCFVPAVIADERASPAARRLATRLTFASYVMGPQLASRSSWCDDITPSEIRVFIQSSLEHFLRRDFADNNSTAGSTLVLLEQEKTTCAMLISLYALSDSALENSGSSTAPLRSFQPHTAALLLRMVQFIMHSDSPVSALNLVSPPEDLDVSQTILIRWGDVVPWCWMTWEDQRIADVESITYLTTSWLYHLETSFDSAPKESPESWCPYLTSHLLKNPTAASVAVLQILHCGVLHLSSGSTKLPPSITNVLFKACWAAVYLSDPALAASWKTQHFTEMVKCLCCIFVLVDDSSTELQIKDLVIEALVLLGPEAMRTGFNKVLEDASFRFGVVLDDYISKSTRLLYTDGERAILSDDDVHHIKHILNFLTIIWYSRTTWCFHFQTVSSFFGALLEWLSAEPSPSLPSTILLDSLLTSLTALELFKKDPFSKDDNQLYEYEIVWQLVMKSRRSNAITAGAFAQYICTMATHSFPDTVTCAEAWDYLRDTVLLILSHQVLGDAEPIAILAIPSVCQALVYLLNYGNAILSTFIISSPWTTTLYTELQNLLNQGGDETSTQYIAVLRERITSQGKALLSQIKHKLYENNDGTPRVGDPLLDLRLIFLRLQPFPRLILVPCDM